MTDGQIAAIRRKWHDGRYAYFSRDVGDPMRGIEQGGDDDVGVLLDALGAARAENTRLREALEHYATMGTVSGLRKRAQSVDLGTVARAALARTEPVP